MKKEGKWQINMHWWETNRENCDERKQQLKWNKIVFHN
jgi:hypothetical protein